MSEFQTDREQQAFNDATASLLGANLTVEGELLAIWSAARAFFTEDATKEGPSLGVRDGYFDEQRAHIRLEVLRVLTGPTVNTTNLKASAEEFTKWALGEETP